MIVCKPIEKPVEMLRLRMLGCFVFAIGSAVAQPSEPLHLVGSVPMPNVEGRIDHMSIDVKQQRLFVAALGNNTLEVIDVKNEKRIHTITGLHEPQGVAYTPDANPIYVANGSDGSLRIFDGSSFQLLKTSLTGTTPITSATTRKRTVSGLATVAVSSAWSAGMEPNWAKLNSTLILSLFNLKLKGRESLSIFRDRKRSPLSIERPAK